MKDAADSEGEGRLVGKGAGPFSLPWNQDIPFPGMLLCQEMGGKKNNLCQQLL